jgi:BirA family biotin operon repressor/biotin-[acetyl-CoA-carboxylase] ligase
MAATIVGALLRLGITVTDCTPYPERVNRPLLDAAALQASLQPPWTQLTVVDETASTNADLIAQAGTAAAGIAQAGTAAAGGAAGVVAAGVVLVAEHQTAGRGRLERGWTSPPRSGLTFSALVRPASPLATWGWLPLLAGVAVCDAVTATGVKAALKWPNDLLVGDEQRKAAGILVQVASDAAVIGIGLNVSTTSDELPVPTAASLATEGVSVDRTALLAAILVELGRQYDRWQATRGDAWTCGLAADYHDRCATLEQNVLVTTADGGSFSGVASGIDTEGRLRISADGAEHVVAAGDIEHVRPTG